MCELFGICAAHPILANPLLRAFYQHSEKNRDGWGMALFHGRSVSIEKEPLMASKSDYLKHRLETPIVERALIAHIREASIGRIEHANCHPFTGEDATGRTWTLAHNGTLFDGTLTAAYKEKQLGTTDSERVLLYLLDSLKPLQDPYRQAGPESPAGWADLPEERFSLLEERIASLAENNNLSLLFYDGTYMYAHTNREAGLHVREAGGVALLATKPVFFGGWEQLQMNTLHVFRDGALVWRGKPHDHTFVLGSKDMTSLFGAYAEL